MDLIDYLSAAGGPRRRLSVLEKHHQGGILPLSSSDTPSPSLAVLAITVADGDPFFPFTTRLVVEAVDVNGFQISTLAGQVRY
jgi:hypothetical protein